MIEIHGIRKRYHNGTYALKGVSLDLKEKFTSIIGRNGAGKTTLMRILSTQLLPTSGTALINGYDVVKDANKIRKIILSIPQEADPIGYLTPAEHLKIYLAARGMSFHSTDEEAMNAMKELELWDARDTPADMLSGGMKRKIFVAMALASNADTIFLDEPTTGLDPLSKLQVWSAIRKLTGNIVLTTHYMEEAQELSKEIAIIDGGKCMGKGTVHSLLGKFDGLLHAETSNENEKNATKQPAYIIGSTVIKYIHNDEAEAYLKKGYIVKPITLDDVFITKGVDIES